MRLEFSSSPPKRPLDQYRQSAAGLVRIIRARQAHGDRPRSIYVGLERPDNAHAFDEVRLGPAAELLPSLFAYAPTNNP